MRFLALATAALATIATTLPEALPASSPRSIPEPVSAPSLALPDIRDRVHDLKDYLGRVVLVNFWASWCPPCLVEMPGMQRMAQRFGDRSFKVLAVNVGEGKNQTRRALKLTGFRGTVLLDSRSAAFEEWGASVLPTSYLIDRAGRIRYEAVGPLDWEGDDAAAAVGALLKEAPPPTSTMLDAACYAAKAPTEKGCRP